MSDYVSLDYVNNNYILAIGNVSIGRYAADGSWNITAVSGSTRTGLQAVDGSINVVLTAGTSFTGLQHPCGGLWVYRADADWSGGLQHPCGALVVSITPFKKNTIPVTVVSGTISPTLAAPTLDWDDQITDNLPDYTLTWDAQLDDIATLRRSTASDFSTYEDATDVVDSLLPGAVLEFNFGDVWADGTWYTKAFYTRTGFESTHSSTETLTIDTTGPSLSSLTDTQTGNTTASLSATTAEANVTVYVVVTTSTTTPTAAQIIAGDDHLGANAVYASSALKVAAGAQAFSATGLSASTQYYAHFVGVDANTNQGTPASADGFVTTGSVTAALTSPSSAPAASPDGNDTLVATVTTDTGSGTLYTVASTSSTVPTGAQIEAGQMHTGGAAAAAANVAVASTGVKTLNVGGSLTNSTRYWLHTVQKTGSNYSNITTADAYTDVDTTYITTQSTTGTASISGNNINWANVDVGNAHPNKALLVLCGHNGGSAKHDGFAATSLTPANLFDYSTASDTANANCISGWIIPCSGGGTIAGLQLQLTAAPTRGAASFYVIDRSTTPTEVINSSSASAAGITGLDIHVPPYGCAFGIATTTSDLSTVTWTGLTTEDYDAEPAGGTWSFSTARYANNSASDLLNRSVETTYLTNPSSNLRFGVVSFGDHV